MSDFLEAVLGRDAQTQTLEADLAPGSDPAADVAGLRQFVTFYVSDETFAVPLNDVQEIIRLPLMVEMPRATPNLEGLANLRGAVLPIINLRRVFEMDDIAHDDATRVVVINNGAPIGFVVDRMSRVVTAEPREIETMDGIRSTVDNDMLDGVIKREQAMIMMLNTQKLTASLRSAAAHRSSTVNRDAGAPSEGRRTTIASDEIQLVSFEIDQQEYALPIQNVQEIVQIPGKVTKISNAQSHVLGVMNLRDRLLPLVSLRSLFGLPAAEVDERSRIVVVAQKINGEEHAVGLVTDTVKEVLRVQRSIVDPLPNMLASGGGFSEIDQICRLEGGKRLVSILLPDRLFKNTGIRDALGEAAAMEQDADMSGSSDNAQDPIDEEEQFVVFRVADEEYGVPIHVVQEIVRVPDQLTRVPKAPSFVEGVVNLRGAVLPVIDQRRRFSLPSIAHNERQRIMVFTLDGVRTGFIVDSVSEVLKISRSQISPAPEVATYEDSAVSSVANIVNLERMILMIDIERLLSKRETHALSEIK